jgi:hypothetical protein
MLLLNPLSLTRTSKFYPKYPPKVAAFAQCTYPSIPSPRSCLFKSEQLCHTSFSLNLRLCQTSSVHLRTSFQEIDLD